ncbi:MAG: hypothetical protein M1569_01780 [Candidatus Marsarchaeota archaeon]|nr:hypothetical protein [Candidatus Marsarchaeota archaeon]MCL5413111.1 hypothetical protein [Candidatus Marsarchaeota archaeon]
MTDNPSNTGAPLQQVGAHPALSMKAVAAVVIVIAILAGAAYIFYSPSKSSQVVQSSVSSASSASAFQAELSSQPNKTLAGVMGVEAVKVASLSNLNVTYAGHALISLKGAGALGNVQFTIPFVVSYQKLGNNSRMYFNASGIPILGNMTGTEISLANGTSYSCTSISSFEIGAPSNTAGVRCILRSKTLTGSQSPALQSSVNLTQLGSTVRALNTQQPNSTSVVIAGQRQYNGQGCVFVLMNGRINQSNMTGDFSANMCLSNLYYIPLNLTISANVTTGTTIGYDIAASLNETSIGTPTTLASISSLPGPIENATSTGYPTPTGYPTSANVTSNYTNYPVS